MARRIQWAVTIGGILAGLSACFPEDYPCSPKGDANLQMVSYDADMDTYSAMDESLPLMLDMVPIGGSGSGQGGLVSVQPGIEVHWAAAGVSRRANEVSITTSIPGISETELLGEGYPHLCEPEWGWTARMGLPVETLVPPIELFGKLMTIAIEGRWPQDEFSVEYSAVVDPRPIYIGNDYLCNDIGEDARRACLDQGRDTQDCERVEAAALDECLAGFPDWEL